jgi:ketosteroid isomerase-like protein
VSRDPVEIVLEQFAATNERDFERAMEIYADDVVLTVGEGWGITEGTYEGKRAVGEWFGDWFRQFAPGYHFEITEARDMGNGVVLLAAEHGGAGRASGVEVGGKTGYLYRVVNDRITRVHMLVSPEEAHEAASLPEWSKPETD